MIKLISWLGLIGAAGGFSIMRKRLVFLVCLLSLFSTACASAPKQTTPSQPKAIEMAQEVDSSAVNKVDNLILYPEIVKQAWQRSISRCMTEHGFPAREYYYMPYNESIRESVSPPPLSVEDVRQNRRYSLTTNTQVLEQNAHLSEQELQTLRGTNDPSESPSCMSTAMEEIFGSVELGNEYLTVNKRIFMYTSEIPGSSPMLETYKTWEQCMRDDYQMSYTSPGNILYQYRSGDIPQDILIADASCREKVQFEEHLNHVMNGYMTTFLEQNQALMERVAQAKANAEHNASKILDGSA